MLSLIPDFMNNCPAAQADQALKQAVGAYEKAEHAVVLWFGEILSRGLFRELGHSSIYQYATVELKWSKTRTGDFMRLARKLEELPRAKGGTNDHENLITLYSACHRLWHEHGGVSQAATRIPSAQRR